MILRREELSIFTSKRISFWNFWAFLILSAIHLSACQGLLYHPTDFVYTEPTKLKPPPEELWIPQTETEKIHAWYFKTSKTSRGLIIHFHGNAENLTSHVRGMHWVVDEGFDYLIFDYRGYGKSDGTPSPKHSVQDGLTVVGYARDRFPKSPLILFGQSLGGNVALRTAIEAKALGIPLAAVAVEGSFSSYKHAATSVLSKSWITWPFQPLGWLFLSDTYAPQKRIHELSPDVPLLVIHGERDHIIELSLGEEIFAQAKEPKEFWRVSDAGHLECFWSEEGMKLRKDFIAYLKKWTKASR